MRDRKDTHLLVSIGIVDHECQHEAGAIFASFFATLKLLSMPEIGITKDEADFDLSG